MNPNQLTSESLDEYLATMTDDQKLHYLCLVVAQYCADGRHGDYLDRLYDVICKRRGLDCRAI